MASDKRRLSSVLRGRGEGSRRMSPVTRPSPCCAWSAWVILSCPFGKAPVMVSSLYRVGPIADSELGVPCGHDRRAGPELLKRLLGLGLPGLVTFVAPALD